MILCKIVMMACIAAEQKRDPLRGSSVKLGTMYRILAWPLRRDDAHTSRRANDESQQSREDQTRLRNFTN